MPVTKETLLEMRQTLESDRELCAGSPLAQAYLDGCETIQNSLAIELAERLIGMDTADNEELRTMASDLSRWVEDLDNIPVSERGSASYQAAVKFFHILKRNYVLLYRKNDLENLPVRETATVS
jgi:hypothetical protein